MPRASKPPLLAHALDDLDLGGRDGAHALGGLRRGAGALLADLRPRRSPRRPRVARTPARTRRPRPHAGSSSVKVVAPRRRVDREAALHALGEVARDREPQPGALRVVGRVEGLEDALHGGALDAGSRVADRELHASVLARRAHHDVRAVGRVGERIVEQDTNDLGHALGVAGDRDLAIGKVQRDLRSGGARRAGVNSPATLRASSPRSTCSGRSSSEPASRRERSSSSVASTVQAVDLVAHLAEELMARLLVELLVLEQLDEPAEREERRAQLVRGRRR